MFKFLCLVFIILGLAWVYTFFYGGPLVPFYAWLAEYLPQGKGINLNPAPLNH